MEKLEGLDCVPEISGITDIIFAAFNLYLKDTSEQKVNLTIGVYRDNDDKPYILPVVKKASPNYTSMEYTPISGVQEFLPRAQMLAFGKDNKALKENKIVTLQTISGTGAIRLAADLLAAYYPHKEIFISNPTWDHHVHIFNSAGLKVKYYAYYDNVNKRLDFENLIRDLNGARDGSIVLLHACAHNPTGMDPTQEQWRAILQVVKNKKMLPFIDMAYQGFASGDLDQDAFALRLFSEALPELILCQSFSKNMGLYGQRCGCVHVQCRTDETSARVFHYLKTIGRNMYSTPPIHGALIANNILSDPELTEQWKKELKSMADRMNNIRKTLVKELKALGSKVDWSHIEKQIGMMAFSGLNKEQAELLRDKWHIYMLETGRVAISGVNTKNVKYVAKAFHDVTSNSSSQI